MASPQTEPSEPREANRYRITLEQFEQGVHIPRWTGSLLSSESIWSLMSRGSIRACHARTELGE